jgi:uncharacterized RDD family membrane protein YckC
MLTDLQKASFGKRIIAAIFDGILLSILAVGLATILSLALGYNNYYQNLTDISQKYESQYGIDFQITHDEFIALTDAEKENWHTANEAFGADAEAQKNYSMIINLSVLILSFSILPAVLVIEFVVPLIFGNGQTLGKKIFGIAIMNTEGVKVNNVQLFARAVLGKFAIEIMIPLSIIFMICLNMIGITGIIVLSAILILEIICLIATRTNSPIHDLLAQTVAVDMASQRIFESHDALIEYTKARHAEAAAKATY